MAKGLYSAAHDQTKNPGRKIARRKKGRKARKPVAFTPGVSQVPTDARRRRLRELQLQGDVDPRRQYETQYGVNYSEPHILPPRHDLRDPNPLPDPDIHGDETNLPDVDLQRRAATEENLPRIAELPVGDASIIQFDNQLTTAFNTLRSLKTAADALLQRVGQEANPQSTHHAEQITWILEEAILPWLEEVDGHLDGIIEVTPEGQMLEEGGEQI